MNVIDSTQTKACPVCAETIKAAAKLCPFCQTPQTRFAAWRRDLGLLLSVLLLIALAIAVCAWLFRDFGSNGRSFANHRSDLAVVRTSLEPADKNQGPSLVGYVTNRGNYPWRVHELEVRVLDAKGRLVDARHPDVPEPFVVQPHHENAFRARLGQLAVTNSGIVQQVRVEVATDVNRDVKPD